MKSIISSAFLLFICGIISGQTSTINKQFKTGDRPSLYISNSFGFVNVTPHDKKTIEVLVEIDVVPTKKQDVAKVKERIDVNVKETGNRIELSTINKLDGIKTEKMEINYTVLIPRLTDLEIKNSFGDVRVYGSEGNFKLDLKHGDGFTTNLNGKENYLSVQFGDLRVGDVDNASIRVMHGELTGSVLHDLNLELKFSDGTIERLGGDVKLVLMHSDLKVESVSEKTSAITADANFSDLKLYSGTWNNYTIDLNGSFSDFKWPNGLKASKTVEKMHNEEHHIESTDSQGRKVQVNAMHSSVELQ